MSTCNGSKLRESLDRSGKIGTRTGPPAALPMPDFADVHRQRQQHPHVTQQLLWEEYRQANPDGYRYSRFCELYQRWRRKQ
jgi:transposase